MNFSAVPTADELALAVNRTSIVDQLSTNNASLKLLSEPSVPRLSANMHLARDRNFRMRAKLPIALASGIDIGSNENRFWFEVPEGMGMRKTLYFANHDAYRRQLDRSVLPVDPTWLMDAIGLMRLDPQQVIAGPQLRRDGRYEVRSRMATPGGDYQRVCYIDPSGGYVVNQLLFDNQNRLVASSEATDFVYYPIGDSGCPLPHEVRIHLIPAGGPPLSMQLSVGNYVVNTLLSGEPDLFRMPNNGSVPVDLTQLGPMPSGGDFRGVGVGTPQAPGRQSLPASYRQPVDLRAKLR